MASSIKQIKNELRNASSIFEFTVSAASNNQGLHFIGLNNIREIINILDRLGLFKDQVDFLKKSAIYTTSSDSMNINSGEGSQIKTNLDQLKILLSNIEKMLDSVVPEESEDSINIKLPNYVNTFAELSEVSKQINNALIQPLRESDIKCETTISSVENGSIWINLYLSCGPGLLLVAKLIHSAIIIRKEKFNGDYLKEQARELKKRNDKIDVEEFEKATLLKERETIENQAEQIKSEYFTQASPEDVERIKFALTTLTDLLNKGLMVKHSISSSKEVENFFPTELEILGIENKTKQISSAENSNHGESSQSASSS